LLTIRTNLLVAMALGLVLVCGCGPGGPEIIPVDGWITLGGSPWPSPGVVYFTLDPAATGNVGHPVTGKFDVDGKLTVTTFGKNGLAPGKYKLGIECWKVAPRMGSPTPPVSYVPERYQSAATSGLSVLVESGKRVVEVRLDVPKT
jgi:hypothetical protein